MDEQNEREDEYRECRYCGSGFVGSGDDCGGCRLDERGCEDYCRVTVGLDPIAAPAHKYRQGLSGDPDAPGGATCVECGKPEPEHAGRGGR